eukprot:2556544-Alexandrium_andersonii.AAC.1
MGAADFLPAVPAQPPRGPLQSVAPVVRALRPAVQPAAVGLPRDVSLHAVGDMPRATPPPGGLPSG